MLKSQAFFFPFIPRIIIQEGAALGSKNGAAPKVEMVGRPTQLSSQLPQQSQSKNPLDWFGSLFRRSDHAYQPIDGQLKPRKVSQFLLKL